MSFEKDSERFKFLTEKLGISYHENDEEASKDKARQYLIRYLNALDEQDVLLFWIDKDVNHELNIRQQWALN